MESNTETIAKRARVGPRTPVVLTMEMLLKIVFTSKKCLLITLIVLDYVLKLWVEQITLSKDNAMEKLYRV